MTFIPHDLKRPKYSQREVDFILHNLELDGYRLEIPNDINYLGYIIDIKHKLDTTRKIYFTPKFCLVSEDSIRWLKDDLRVALWFYAFLVIKQKWSINLLTEHTIFHKDLILSFDSQHREVDPKIFVCRDFFLMDKNRVIKTAVPFYNSIKTSNKDLSWLDRKDQEQMNWALEYLQEKKLLINAPTFLAINTKECYAQVCASLDALDMHSDLQQKLIDSYPRESNKADRPDQTMTNGKRDTPRETTLAYRDNSEARYNSEAFKKLFKDVYEASDAKRELLTRMRTAWNQKVFREKNPVKAEKKIKLPHGYEKKVKEISEAYGEDMVACLKRIIDEKHNAVKPDS